MLWAQIAALALLGGNLLLGAYRHGKGEKRDEFWTTLVAVAVVFTIHYFAGTFSLIF